MSLSSNSKIEWSDIVSLYAALNQARSKFSFQQVAVPEEQNNEAKADHIKTLNSFVVEMKSNSKLSSVITGITPPQRGEALDASSITTLQTQIQAAFDTCNFGNSSFGDSAFSFSNTSFGNTAFGNSTFGNTGFSNSAFGNTGFANSAFSFGSNGNSNFFTDMGGFGCSDLSFNSNFFIDMGGFGCRSATDMGGFGC